MFAMTSSRPNGFPVAGSCSHSNVGVGSHVTCRSRLACTLLPTSPPVPEVEQLVEHCHMKQCDARATCTRLSAEQSLKDHGSRRHADHTLTRVMAAQMDVSFSAGAPLAVSSSYKAVNLAAQARQEHRAK
jgi:hypothetical protein